MKQFLFFITAKSYGTYLNFLCFVAPQKAGQIAYSLFSQPRKGKLIHNQLPPFLAEAKKETFESKGQLFQTYQWKGNGKTVFLLHGWESNSVRWKKIIPYLVAKNYHIIAIDAPAHGLSSGKEFNVLRYAALVDVVAQKYPPHYCIAHSIGGKTSLYYQATYQNPTLEKIVLLGAPADFKIIFENYLQLLSFNKRMEQLLHQHYWHHFQIKVDEFSAKYFAPKVNSKGLIIHDEMDTVVVYNEGKKINQYWKDSILETTNGLGHSLQNKTVYQKIIEFLAEPQ